jgi:hypothetical protein
LGADLRSLRMTAAEKHHVREQCKELMQPDSGAPARP